MNAQVVIHIENPKGWLTPKGAAEFLDVSVRQLEKWRAEGGGPKFVKPNPKKVYYRIDDLFAFVQSFPSYSNIEEYRQA